MLNKERPEVIDAMVHYFGTDSDVSYAESDMEKDMGYKGEIYSEDFEKWANSEYIEPFKITRDEKCILENIEKDHEFCFTLMKKNIKGDLIIYEANTSVWFCFWMYNHLFKFIEKDKTYVIEDILNNCEVIENA